MLNQKQEGIYEKASLVIDKNLKHVIPLTAKSVLFCSVFSGAGTERRGQSVMEAETLEV